MAVVLDEDEVRAVKWALDNYLPELSYEVARVARERDRHEIARHERVLQRLRDRLAVAAGAALSH